MIVLDSGRMLFNRLFTPYALGASNSYLNRVGLVKVWVGFGEGVGRALGLTVR